jgi:hypothetical protein
MHAIAIVVVGTLLVIAGLHLYWVTGGGWGVGVAVPERAGVPVFRPGPVATLAVVAGLVAAALLLGARAGLVSPAILPPPLPAVGSWLVAAALLLRGLGDFRYVGLFRRVRGTRFAEWDARLFTPLALALGSGAAIVAWGGT